jgi:hypothetical protein
LTRVLIGILLLLAVLAGGITLANHPLLHQVNAYNSSNLFVFPVSKF